MVICAYGEESAIREASLSRGVDAAGVLVVAAIAIPNLLRARISANEASAVATIRTANVAQISYSSAYLRRGFARDLATLGRDPAAPATPSPDHAGLLDATVGNASCTASAWCTKSGFQFRITAVCKKKLRRLRNSGHSGAAAPDPEFFVRRRMELFASRTGRPSRRLSEWRNAARGRHCNSGDGDPW